MPENPGKLVSSDLLKYFGFSKVVGTSLKVDYENVRCSHVKCIQ